MTDDARSPEAALFPSVEPTLDPRISDGAQTEAFQKGFIESVTSPVFGAIVETVLKEAARYGLDGTPDNRMKLALHFVWFARTALVSGVGFHPDQVLLFMQDIVLMGEHMLQEGLLETSTEAAPTPPEPSRSVMP